MSKLQCAGRVWDGVRYVQCTRKGTVGCNGKLYCKRHDPAGHVERLKSIPELYLDALTENAKLKAELDSAIADRDRWERNSAAENKRAGDLEIKLRQVDAERDRARKAGGIIARINADHDAEIRRKALEEAAKIACRFCEGLPWDPWIAKPADGTHGLIHYLKMDNLPGPECQAAKIWRAI